MLKHNERNYKSKNCKLCDTEFKPKFPNQQYCCTECSTLSKKQYNKKWYRDWKIKKVVFINKVKRCSICNEPLNDHRKFVHFECVVDQVRKGFRSKQILKYFWNHGYSMTEIRQMIKEESEDI